MEGQKIRTTWKELNTSEFITLDVLAIFKQIIIARHALMLFMGTKLNVHHSSKIIGPTKIMFFRYMSLNPNLK